jgi:hypothetical protein
VNQQQKNETEGDENQDSNDAPSAADVAELQKESLEAVLPILRLEAAIFRFRWDRSRYNGRGPLSRNLTITLASSAPVPMDTVKNVAVQGLQALVDALGLSITANQ